MGIGSSMVGARRCVARQDRKLPKIGRHENVEQAQLMLQRLKRMLLLSIVTSRRLNGTTYRPAYAIAWCLAVCLD